MRGTFVIAMILLAFAEAFSFSGLARGQDASPRPASADFSKPVSIDGIAVRIESDIITDSQVRELAAYQRLVDGESQPRSEVIRELIDQWIIRGEATAAQYPQPSKTDVDKAFEGLERKIGSAEQFRQRCLSAGITEDAVRRILAQQIYLTRFLDFRFRPAAQVSAAQIQKYYDDHLVPQLKAKGEKVPPLSDVQAEIREVLTQQDIDKLSKQWLDDTRSGLNIDIVAQGEGN